MNGSDFEFLVNETLKMNEASTTSDEDLRAQDGQHDFQNEIVDEKNIQEGIPKTQSGVIYRLEKSGALVKIRCLESSSLADDWKGLNTLTESFTEVGFFETENFSDASMLAKNFNSFKLLGQSSMDYQSYSFNKLWWGILDDSRFTVSFGKIPARKEGQFYDLGPLGDHSLAKFYFKVLNKYLVKSFGLVEPVEEDKSYSWQFDCKENAEEFLKLFWGDKSFNREKLTGIELEGPAQEIEYLSLLQYLTELELFRAFWQKVGVYFSNPENATRS